MVTDQEQKSVGGRYVERRDDDTQLEDMEKAMSLLRDAKEFRHSGPDDYEFSQRHLRSAIEDLREAIAWKKSNIAWDVIMEVEEE